LLRPWLQVRPPKGRSKTAPLQNTATDIRFRPIVHRPKKTPHRERCGAQ
jgi:hypothetical protein